MVDLPAPTSSSSTVHSPTHSAGMPGLVVCCDMGKMIGRDLGFLECAISIVSVLVLLWPLPFEQGMMTWQEILLFFSFFQESIHCPILPPIFLVLQYFT